MFLNSKFIYLFSTFLEIYLYNSKLIFKYNERVVFDFWIDIYEDCVIRNYMRHSAGSVLEIIWTQYEQLYLKLKSKCYT